MTVRHARWILGAFLFASTMLNYLDRLAIGIVSVEIRREFGLGERDYSYVLFFFFLAYSVMYAGSGWLLDRLGTRRGFAIFIAGWSIAQMLHGFSVGFISLTVCRFLLGLTEPGAWPAAAKAVREWLPAKQRALYMGVFNSGSAVGSALAPVVVASVTIAFGWRAAFVTTGMAGGLWLIGWLVFYQQPERSRWLASGEYARHQGEFAPPEEADAGKGRGWRELVATRGCWTLILSRFFTDPVIYFAIFWLPEYLRKERGFDLAMVRDYSWVPFAFGGVGYVFGGWISGWLIRRGWTVLGARKAGIYAGASLMPFAMLAPFVPTATLAIAATCFLTLGHGLWTSNLQTLPADLYPGREVGRVMGFSGSGGAVGGMFAQLATGWLVTHFSYAPVFLIAGLMHPLSAWMLSRWLTAGAVERERVAG